MGLSEKYKIAAGVIDLEFLAEKCPKGFAPFAKEIQSRIGSLISN